MHSFGALLMRFRSDERGIFAVIFGVMAIVLVALAGAAVDYTAMETARTRAQIALDSAALGLAPYIYDDDISEEQLIADAQALVTERLNDPTVAINITGAGIDDVDGKLRFSGTVTVPMAFVQLVGIPSLTANIVSEATKGSINLEVAVALDITKSMDGDKIDDLEDAISELIDMVVKEDQDPTYSRMAIVPYSLAVNVGAMAPAIRGAATQATGISGASWGTTTGTITAITKANKAIVTSANHGLQTGDRIVITGVKGMTQINNPQSSSLGSNKAYRVVRESASTFSLQRYSDGQTINTNSTSYSAYTSAGTWKKCFTTSCEVMVTSDNHGLLENDYVRIRNVTGMTQINNTGTGSSTTTLSNFAWVVGPNPTQNTFILKDTFGPDYGTYSSNNNDTAQCAVDKPGRAPCQIVVYKAADNSTYNMRTITTCVTERETSSYTAAPPSNTPFGAMYPVRISNTNGWETYKCPDDQIMPLTDSLDDLHAATDNFTTTGSTAGHIGLAWAWYMLKPAFGYLWDGEVDRYAPADPTLEDADPVVKVIVLMTDGEFNTAYCQGVASKNSAQTYAGSNNERINCNASVDTSSNQAVDLCDQIREDETVVVYTVAFALSEITNQTERERAQQIMTDCATEASYAYTAEDGATLLDAFRAIGRNITDLRLSL